MLLAYFIIYIYICPYVRLLTIPVSSLPHLPTCSCTRPTVGPAHHVPPSFHHDIPQ